MMQCRTFLVTAALLLCSTMPARAENPSSPTAPVVTPPAAAVVTPPAAAAVQAITEPAPPAPALRVGYADITKIAEKSAPGKAAKARFDVKADKLKAQVETRQKLLEKQKATLEAKLPTYSPDQRAARIKEYEKKVEEFRKLLQKADKELKPMQEELLKEIYAKIEKAATEYGAANGYSLIMVKNDLLYLGKNVDVQDVTDALIKHLGQ